MEKFTVTWGVDDGYAGKARPQHSDISDGDFDEYYTEEELRNLFWEFIEGEFLNNISTYSDDEDAFVEWAKEQQERMRKEDV